MKLHHFGLIAATLALGAWLIPGDTDPSPFTPAYAQENSAAAWVDRENFQIRSEIGGLEVHASINNPRNATVNELFRVAIAVYH